MDICLLVDRISADAVSDIFKEVVIIIKSVKPLLCIKCGHRWLYKGNNHIAWCPKCGYRNRVSDQMDTRKGKGVFEDTVVKVKTRTKLKRNRVKKYIE